MRGRPRGADEPVAAERMRAAQDPELGEPGQVAELPGDRVEAGTLRHAPVVAVEGEAQGRRAAVAQRRGEVAAGETARVSDHRDRLRGMPSSTDGCIDRAPGPRVLIVSPAAASANNGNWHTAARWQRFLAPVAEASIRGPGEAVAADAADLLIALHARRSAEAIERWRAARPDSAARRGADRHRPLSRPRP